MTSRLFPTGILLLAALPVMASTTTRAAERPVVVELFTSEGCSSCPPAEAYLNELARRPGVLPLAFHVTYWDRLGWKDRYSLEAATARQARYGGRFGDGSYTPEIVVDGAKSFVGSDRGEGAAAIASAGASGRGDASVDLSRDGRQVSIRVGAGSGNGRVLLVGFDPEHRTAIGRGENTGRTITESNVVRSVRTVGQWSGAALDMSVALPEGQDLAVLIEAPDGRIIGAARSNAGA